MLTRSHDWMGEGFELPYEDLQDYAEQILAAEETKCWAEEQLKALLPAALTVFAGPFEISRRGEAIAIKPRCLPNALI